ncbi:LacI family DNA-binding transcriptional regulator [Dermabacteraceae bacterium P7074]
MSSRTRRGPSMTDVARHARVSAQTVSRVLNDPEAVRESTRVRVLAAIEELGYRRNLQARSLRTDRSDVIGVVTAATSIYSPSRMLHEIESAARQAGLALQLAVLDDATRIPPDAVFASFMERNVDGVILVGPRNWVALTAQEFTGSFPIVSTSLVDVYAENRLRMVCTDNELGARLAVRHLIGLGHRLIDHVAGPREFYDAVDRMRGWRKELFVNGLLEGRLFHGEFDARSGYEIGRRMIASGRLPDAVFCANDQMALGLCRALHEAGISVPGEVSVVGFDNIDGCEYTVPSLTTVEQPYRQIGEGAVAALRAALLGRESAPRLVQPRLVVRESTGPRFA